MFASIGRQRSHEKRAPWLLKRHHNRKHGSKITQPHLVENDSFWEVSRFWEAPSGFLRPTAWHFRDQGSEKIYGLSENKTHCFLLCSFSCFSSKIKNLAHFQRQNRHSHKNPHKNPHGVFPYLQISNVT